MEDDEIDTSSGGGLLAMALAVLAIVLGGAGLYFGMTANQRLSPLADSLEVGSGAAARLEKSMDTLETRLAELSSQHSELEGALSRLRVYSNQSERAVKQIDSGMRENRAELVKLAGRLNELVASRAAPAAVAPAPAVTESGSESPRASLPDEPAGEGTTADTYTIVTGDTFARIAAKLDVGLQDLLDANPGVDPRRLRIGQVINIPAAR